MADKASTAQKGIGYKIKNMTDTNMLLTITIVIFFLMYIGAIVFKGEGFFSPQTFLSMLNANGALIITSCGMSLVMITGGIDISVGGVVALVSMCSAVYLDYLPWYRSCLWYCSGLSGSLLRYPAIYCIFGRYVLCQRYDDDRQHQSFQCAKRSIRCIKGYQSDRSGTGFCQQIRQICGCICRDRCGCSTSGRHPHVYHAPLDQVHSCLVSMSEEQSFCHI